MSRSEIKTKLELAIQRTKESIVEYTELSRPEAPDVAIGRVSRMDAINNRSIVEAALRKSKEKLNNLEKVYSMVGSDDFGICLKCKSQIPIERILIRPESMLCVNCAH